MNSKLLKKVNTLEEAGKVEKLAFLIWNEHYASLLSQEQRNYMLSKFQSKEVIFDSLSSGYEYYLVQHDEKDVGYIGIKKENEKLFLSKFYILKEYRNKKIGKNIIEVLNSYCKESNMKGIYLTVNKHNDSVDKYFKLGFKIVDDVVTDIGNGFVMDDYIMERPIC